MPLAGPPKREAEAEINRAEANAPDPEREAPAMRPTIRLNGSVLNLEDSAELTVARVKAVLAQTQRKADGYAKKTRCAYSPDSAAFKLKKSNEG